MSGIVLKRGFEGISSTSDHTSVEDERLDIAKQGRKEATPPAVSSVLGKRATESEPAPIKISRVSSLADEDNSLPHIAEQTNDTKAEDLLSSLPNELLGHIADFCPVDGLLALSRTSQKLRYIAFDRLLSRATGAHSIDVENEIRSGLKEVAKIARRMDALRKGGVSLPTDMIELHDRVVRHSDRNDAEKLKRFMDLRDNLIFWKHFEIYARHVADAGTSSAFNVDTGTSYEVFENAYNELDADPLLKDNPAGSKYGLLCDYFNSFQDFCNKFDFSNMQLSSIPSDLLRYFHIDNLCLGGNFITEIPKKLKNQIYFRRLELQNNQITEIPDFLSKLVRLQRLSVQGNPLKELPDFLKNRENLEVTF